MDSDGETARRALIESARESLAVYQGLVQRTLTGRPAIPPSHLRDTIIPILENDALGPTVIVAPPESAKTITLISACAWWLGQNPSQHIGYICNTGPPGVDRSRAIRDIISQSAVHRQIFPDSIPDQAKGWGEGAWFLKRPNIGDKDPTLMGVGVHGDILGKRLDRIILDDIADQDNMNTQYQREKVIRYLEKTVLTRLSPQGRPIMICTRWSEGDPVAWAVRRGWRLIHIDALLPSGKSYWPEVWYQRKLSCPNGDHKTIEYEGERYCWQDKDETGRPIASGLCRELSVGPLSWVQQYRGRTHDDTTALIKRSLWKYYGPGTPEAERIPLPDKLVKGGIFIDTAHTAKTSADYSVIGVVMTDDINYWVLDMWAGQVEFPALIRKAREFRERFDLPIYVEDTPGGKPLHQLLKTELNRVIPWSHGNKDKMSRVNACLTYWYAGNVIGPSDQTWMEELVEECASFPHGEHDDRVDVMTMALLQLGGKRHIKASAF